MSELSLVAPIKIFNGNPYVYVRAARARAIKPGWRKPLPVLIRINGEPEKEPWRINMMPIGKGDTRQKEILGYFSWLKSHEARARNVARALHVLMGRKGRFMARSW